MADASPGLPELRRDVARIEKRQDEHEREVRESYVRRDVYVAERDGALARIKRIEDEDTSKASGNRTWLLNLTGTILGVIVAGVITVLIARGGH